MTTLIQLIVAGIAIGSVYGLVALGFVTIYRTCGVVNFAQGEFVMLGGMMSYWLWTKFNLPYPLAAVLTLIAVCVVGVGIYQLVVSPLRNGPPVMMVLGTLAVAALIEAISLLWFEGWPIYGPAFTPSIEIINVLGVGLYSQNLWVIAMVAVVVTALQFLNNRTFLGKKMTATATDSLAAGLVGVHPGSMMRLSFLISAVIGGIGGIFISPVIPMTYVIGVGLALKGFVAAVLGGWGTASGAVVGGVALGVIEMLVGGYLPSGFQDAIAFVLLILVLALRPRGVLGKSLIVEES